jgi:hypothetical protein
MLRSAPYCVLSFVTTIWLAAPAPDGARATASRPRPTEGASCTNCEGQWLLYPKPVCINFSGATTYHQLGTCNENCQQVVPCSISASVSFSVSTSPPCALCAVKVRQTPLDPWQTPANLAGSNSDPGCGYIQAAGEVGAFLYCDDGEPTATYVLYIGCVPCH